MITREKVDAFLAALQKLSEEHGVYLHNYGCGCCGGIEFEENHTGYGQTDRQRQVGGAGEFHTRGS